MSMSYLALLLRLGTTEQRKRNTFDQKEKTVIATFFKYWKMTDKQPLALTLHKSGFYFSRDDFSDVCDSRPPRQFFSQQAGNQCFFGHHVGPKTNDSHVRKGHNFQSNIACSNASWVQTPHPCLYWMCSGVPCMLYLQSSWWCRAMEDKCQHFVAATIKGETIWCWSVIFQYLSEEGIYEAGCYLLIIFRIRNCIILFY